MRKSIFAVSALALAGAMLLSSCGVGVAVGYGHDGRWHRGDHRGGHRGGYNVEVVTKAEQSEFLAQDYNIKIDSAAKIVSLANSKDLKSDLANMDLNASDLSALASLNMPADESIHKVALALNESDESVAEVMKDFISDIQSENTTGNLQ